MLSRPLSVLELGDEVTQRGRASIYNNRVDETEVAKREEKRSRGQVEVLGVERCNAIRASSLR